MRNGTNRPLGSVVKQAVDSASLWKESSRDETSAAETRRSRALLATDRTSMIHHVRSSDVCKQRGQSPAATDDLVRRVPHQHAPNAPFSAGCMSLSWPRRWCSSAGHNAAARLHGKTRLRRARTSRTSMIGRRALSSPWCCLAFSTLPAVIRCHR